MKAFWTLLLMLLLAPALQADDVVVIVNPDNPISELTREQVIDLYMGRLLVFPGGETALPLDQAASTAAREFFYRRLVDKSVAEVNAYWARLLFTGRASPPRTMSDSTAVLRAVGNNSDAIGYLEKELVNDSVKVVFRFE